MSQRNDLDRAERLAAAARAHGFQLQRRGCHYFLTYNDELGCSGDLDRVEAFLRKAIADRRLLA